MRDEDASLARSAARGEAPARSRLVQVHGPASFRCARSMGLDEHDAEDVAQEVMLKLLRTIGKYDPTKASIGTLVYKMTVNAVHDFSRRPAQREVRAETEILNSLPTSSKHSDSERMEYGELRALVIASVRTLPERQRQVCVLHDLEGLSVADTAAALAITPTNVRVHLTHARRTLRQRLAHLLES